VHIRIIQTGKKPRLTLQRAAGEWKQEMCGGGANLFRLPTFEGKDRTGTRRRAISILPPL
jgi:hypothetical protein